MRQAPLSPSPAARPARGAVSWVSLVLLLLLAGGGYLAWTWGPVYLIHVQVKQIARDYMNRAVKDPNDAALIDVMVNRLLALDSAVEPDETGALVRVPTVRVDPRQVTWQRDPTSTPPTLHVYFEYTRAVPYPLINRWTEKTLAVDLTEELTRADWGSVR
jgi:hypothetical protein